MSGDQDAESLLVEGFATVEEAVAAHAYLTGFVIEVLRHHRHEPLQETLGYLERLVNDSP